MTLMSEQGTHATVAIATAGALVAMKLRAIQDRRPAAGLDKRTGDAWDIYRLLLDLDGNGAVAAQYASAAPALRVAVASATRRVLIHEAARTRRWLSAGDERMRAVSADELSYVAQMFSENLNGQIRRAR